eukprot:Nk52_evm14s2152 gene=Nk52_evmTU14s2152
MTGAKSEEAMTREEKFLQCEAESKRLGSVRAGQSLVATGLLMRGLDRYYPGFNKKINWRGQLMVTMGAGVIAFWISAEEYLLECNHKDRQDMLGPRFGQSKT